MKSITVIILRSNAHDIRIKATEAKKVLTARKITLVILTLAFAALTAALIYTAFFKEETEGLSGARFVLAQSDGALR